MKKPKHLYLGPVGDNLEKKKKQRREGWMVPIEDLKAAIALYENAPNDPEDDVGGEYDYIVFSVNRNDGKLYILGVNKFKEDDPAAKSSSNSPRDPGEFDDFPPWPPTPAVDN